MREAVETLWSCYGAQGLYTPPSLRGTILYPFTGGGTIGCMSVLAARLAGAAFAGAAGSPSTGVQWAPEVVVTPQI